MQTWWGPIDVDGSATFSSGGSFDVVGCASRVQTDSTPARDLIEVALVSAAHTPSCSGYAAWLGSVARLQGYVDDLLALGWDERPSEEDWSHYVCSEIEASATESFGGEGRYRAVHVLIDVSGGGYDGLFRPAPPGDDPPDFLGGDLLVPGTFVSRTYERSKHGADVLPPGTAGAWQNDDVDPLVACRGLVLQLIAEWEEDRDTWPDRDSVVLHAATHRYYHLYDADDSIELDQMALELGVLMGDWDLVDASEVDLQLTLFNQVARAPGTFPYEQLLMSTRGQTVPLQPEDRLAEFLPILWPEIPELRPPDDDESDDDR